MPLDRSAYIVWCKTFARFTVRDFCDLAKFAKFSPLKGTRLTLNKIEKFSIAKCFCYIYSSSSSSYYYYYYSCGIRSLFMFIYGTLPKV